MKWLLALILVVLIGGNDGRDTAGVPQLLEVDIEARGQVLPEVWRSGGLRSWRQVDGTPDWLSRNTGVPLRVAGERVVVEAEVLVAEPIASPEAASTPPEGGVDGLWRITIYCRLNDDTGAYFGATASGVQVAEVDPETGFRMVACSGHWDFGATFLVAEHWPMVCRDRGSAVVNWNHLDVHFDDCGIQEDPAEGTGWWWLQRVGDRAIVEVIH